MDRVDLQKKVSAWLIFKQKEQGHAADGDQRTEDLFQGHPLPEYDHCGRDDENRHTPIPITEKYFRSGN